MHTGRLTAESIQPDYYKDLSAKLTGAVAEGLGGTNFGGDDYRNSLKVYLEHNVYAFSGAKSLAVMEQFNKLLLDDKGEIKPFSAFKRDALEVDNLYNKTYLQAEYNNAIASAQMAEKWQGLQAFPLLEYRTVGDDRVRPEHAQLDGIILKSSDPLWNRIYPPNAWNCRCTVIPAAATDVPMDREQAKDKERAAGIQPYFKANVGKDKVIYKSNHPYFKTGRYGNIKELHAEKNYGMDSMNKTYAKSDLPAITPMENKTDALGWWAQQAGGEARGTFDVVAADGTTVRFDRQFRDHVLEQNAQARYRYVHKAPEVLQNPDEVWSRMVNGEPSLTYIKYYENAPMILHVDAGGTVRSSTLFEAGQKGKVNVAYMDKIRQGVLKFRP